MAQVPLPRFNGAVAGGRVCAGEIDASGAVQDLGQTADGMRLVAKADGRDCSVAANVGTKGVSMEGAICRGTTAFVVFRVRP